MVIFNQTFRSDKEVIFPDSWHTGKTIIQQFEQTRRSMPWLIASKITQLAIAFLWILLIYVITKGLRELWSVWNEPQNSPKRRQYRKILKMESLLPMLLISASIYILSAFFFIRIEWIRDDLLQGSALWIVVLTIRRVYRIFRTPK